MATRSRTKKDLETELKTLESLQDQVVTQLGWSDGIGITCAIMTLQYALNQSETIPSEMYLEKLKSLK